MRLPGALLASAFLASAELRPPPDLEGVFRHAASPLVSQWLSQDAFGQLADTTFPCVKVMLLLDWIMQKYHTSFERIKSDLNLWKDMLVSNGWQGQTPQEWFTSTSYYALLQPVIEMQRTSQQVMEFLHVLSMVHGERCFYPELRDALGYSVTWLSKLSEEIHKMQLSAVYHSRLSLWEVSTDVLRHLLPTIDVLHAAAQFADSFSEVRLILDKLASHSHDGVSITLPQAEGSPYQDGGGAFSDMSFIVRNLTSGWHLDYALVASLLRLWAAPATVAPGCHTSIADFGAGGGHYCRFFNKTGEYCCFAYDGSPKAAFYTGGAVQTQRLDERFDLGRRFDWLLCIEVLEHIPGDREAVALANLRRHAGKGLVVSWSEHSGPGHPNAKPWVQVRAAVEAAGFELDADATQLMRTQARLRCIRSHPAWHS
ncbi:unnamed protein product [Effrenium voratum]|nr:unnamed protein product [Effrenium voratum]